MVRVVLYYLYRVLLIVDYQNRYLLILYLIIQYYVFPCRTITLTVLGLYYTSSYFHLRTEISRQSDFHIRNLVILILFYEMGNLPSDFLLRCSVHLNNDRNYETLKY